MSKFFAERAKIFPTENVPKIPIFDGFEVAKALSLGPLARPIHSFLPNFWPFWTPPKPPSTAN